MKQEHLRAVVQGEVQGVGFRWAVQREARRLGLSGYAQNLPDGSVLVEAEGAAGTLDELERFLRRGPRYAQVEGLQAQRSDARGDFDGFVTR
jgi:acylphosphatase